MNDEYYLLAGEEKKGPFTFDELTDMDIDIHTEIITPRSDKPQYASELAEFNGYFESKGIYFPTEDNLATFGKRVLAFFIDYFPLYILVETIETQTGLIVLPTNYKLGMPVPDSMFILSMSVLVVFLLYNTIFEATPLKGSLGKMICKLNVVDINGQGLSLPRALGRNLGVILSMTIWIPFLTVAFSEHRQAWYDSLAKTYVIVKPV
jgi:uncharacterized RDD family membrane protein YckC